MLLSIGMIIKNEEKNLRECLSRLRPILSGLECELIIADTGSTDNSVEIAKEFTKHILNIEWKNDFSEARNHTVRAAKGEWYLYLDADDFFEDPGDIIRFFNSGEYKDYGCATFEIWNYNPDGITYAVQHALHLVKMLPETKFQNSIHERIICEGPRKDLKSHIRHIGYENSGDEEKQRMKHERNITLLKKEYIKNPNDPSVMLHIINEYKAAGMLKEFREFLNTAEALGYSNAGHPLFHFYFHSLTYYFLLLDSKEGFTQAIQLVEQYLSRREKGRQSVTSIDMMFFMGYAYLKNRDFAKALTAFKGSYDLINLYLENKLDMKEATTLYINNAGEGGLTRMIIFTAICYAGISEYNNMLQWVKKIAPSQQIYADEFFCESLINADLNAEQELIVFERYIYRAYENKSGQKFVAPMKTALDCLKNKDMRGYIASVKAASGFDPRCDAVIKKQLQLFCC